MSTYFDHCATTQINEKVLVDLTNNLSNYYGNASSLHIIGQQANNLIEQAKKEITEVLNCNKYNIYFTSGATEANNWVLDYALKLNKKNFLESPIEHPSVDNKIKEIISHNMGGVAYATIDNEGRVILSNLEEEIKNCNIDFVSIMGVNNEIGTLQPYKEIAKICHKNKALYHCDGTQLVPNIAIDLNNSDIDFFTFSGHKLGAPKGIGCLCVKKDIDIKPFIVGGHQQNNKRAGTENPPMIYALAEALSLKIKNLDEDRQDIGNKREILISELNKSKYKHIITTDKNIPQIVNVCFKDVSGYSLLVLVSTMGFCISTGSACSSKENTESRVLKAIDIPQDYIYGNIRISLNDTNTIEDIKKLVESIEVALDFAGAERI